MPTTSRRGPAADQVLLLIATGTGLAADDTRSAELDAVVAELVRRDPGLDPDGSALRALTTQLDTLWERGWQPADAVHQAHRRGGRRAGRLAGVAVRAEAAATAATDRAPAAWVRQLAELAPAASLEEWRRREGVDLATAWRDVLRVLAVLVGLPRLEQLLPPPSAWPRHRRRAPDSTGPDTAGPDSAGPVEDRVLGRVRALLDKAESTDFPEEADACTAKAQELMSRYRIDAAVLADRGAPGPGGGVAARRVHLSDPYAEPKAHLAQAAATANGVRVVLAGDLGVATLVGLPGDLELVELLYTSLLVQSTRSLADASRGGAAHTRSPAFRRGFLYSYAARVGERLAAARDEAAEAASASYGAELVPVLARRDEVVARATDELFPRLATRRGRRVDAAGWHAGRDAAERADLGTTRRVGPAG